MENLWTIILAAGEGKRVGLKEANKVTLEISGKPLISQTILNLKSAGVNNIVVVIGHAKESVLNLLDSRIKTVEQTQRLGTGHAVQTALKIIPKNTKYILVLYGDDSYNLDPENLKKIFTVHTSHNNQMTFLTTNLDNPTGIGRIIRDTAGNVVGLVEEKDATDIQKEIKEVNIAVYLFNFSFLTKYLPKIEKSPVTNEYYLTQIIKLGIENSEKIEALKIDHPKWRGINTLEELNEAERLAKI